MRAESKEEQTGEADEIEDMEKPGSVYFIDSYADIFYSVQCTSNLGTSDCIP